MGSRYSAVVAYMATAMAARNVFSIMLKTFLWAKHKWFFGLLRIKIKQ
jgi:hypothetical protein